MLPTIPELAGPVLLGGGIGPVWAPAELTTPRTLAATAAFRQRAQRPRSRALCMTISNETWVLCRGDGRLA
jgi:hypothetical protein